MKYTITGASGNISKPLALQLLKAGHTVTVISRNESNVKELIDAGATAAIGSVEDLSFLTGVFTGADAVYTMVPPNHNPDNWKDYIGGIGELYAEAISASNIKYVVNLSSIGAHLPDGVGPVSGLYRVEQALNALQDVNVKHLRPAYFYQNLLANVGLIKGMGIMGSNFSVEEGKFVIVDPTDIAEVAAEELLNLSFTGKSARYIASDEVSTAQIASVIGTAIGNPALPWVAFTDEQALGGMLQAGLPAEVANNYVEMGGAIRNGSMTEDYWKHRPSSLGKIKLGDFAKQFARIFNA
jgi:uncharacterized protein YbjT (DUF2867 family)